MKRLLLTLFVLTALCKAVSAQSSNLVVFSGTGDLFTLAVNGYRINDRPTGNLKLTGLAAAGYNLQLVFNNPSIPAIMQYVAVDPGRELTLAVARADNGAYNLIFVNEFSLTVGLVPPVNQMIIPYMAPAVVVKDPVIVPPPVVVTQDPNPVVVTPPVVVVVPPKPEPVPGYSGPIGCEPAMEPSAFQQAKESVKSKTYASTKMTLAKQITSQNCLTVTQVREMVDLFTFESDKLEYAKYAYDYTYDIANYYRVNDAFTFESSIDELNQYLEGKQ